MCCNRKLTIKIKLPCLFSKGGIQLCRGTKQGLCTIQVLHSPICADSLQMGKPYHKEIISG